MKLYYIANIRIPTEKAHGIQIVKMCEAFARIGHEVELVVPRRKNSIKDNAFHYYGVEKNFSVRKFPTLDLVSWGKMGFIIQTLTFVFSVFIFSVRNNTAQYFTRDEIIASLLTRMGKQVVWEGHHGQNNRFTRYLIQQKVKMVVISEGLKRFYISHGADEQKIIVLHDAVDLKEFNEIPMLEARAKTSLSNDAFVVGYVGKFKTMGKSKGVEDLIQAFGQFHSIVASAHLLLVGIGEHEKNEVESCIRARSIPNGSVTIVSHVQHSTIVQYLCSSDVLVMNYPKKEHYTDFMSPLKLFEYMASGRAIITSDLPSIREVISEHCALLIEPDSVSALTAGLLELYNSPDVRMRLSTDAKHRITTYTWEARAKAIGEFMHLT